MTPPKTTSHRTESSKSPRIVVVRVELTPTAKRQSASVADRLGMTQIATLSRLVEWFAGQSEEVQKAVLGHSNTAAAGADVVRKIWEQKAGADNSR